MKTETLTLGRNVLIKIVLIIKANNNVIKYLRPESRNFSSTERNTIMNANQAMIAKKVEDCF
jgi:hypothetical protein